VIQNAFDDVGDLISVIDNFSKLTYTFTNRNQITTVDNGGTPNVPHVVLTYTYDPAGNVLTMAERLVSDEWWSAEYRGYDLGELAADILPGPEQGAWAREILAAVPPPWGAAPTAGRARK
jgi:hypothetical protein